MTDFTLASLPSNESARQAAMQAIVDGTYPDAHELIPGVWLGAQGVAGVGTPGTDLGACRRRLRGDEMRVSLIVNVTGSARAFAEDGIGHCGQPDGDDDGFAYFNCNLAHRCEKDGDSVDGWASFRAVIGPLLAAVDRHLDRGQSVLIHCNNGQNRSATVATAVVGRRNRWDLHRSYLHVREVRSLVRSKILPLLADVWDHLVVAEAIVVAEEGGSASGSGGGGGGGDASGDNDNNKESGTDVVDFSDPHHAQQIHPGLWLGPVGSATSKAERKRMGLVAVVSAMAEPPALSSSGLALCHCNLRDDGDDPASPHFIAVNAFIMRQQQEQQQEQQQNASGAAAAVGAVLVHCSSGISRSPTLVIAYLMQSQGWTLKKSYEHVYSKRKCIGVNPQFFADLVTFERELAGAAASEDGAAGLKGFKPSMTKVDYDVLSLSSVTGRPVEECRSVMAQVGNRVEVAIGLLFS